MIQIIKWRNKDNIQIITDIHTKKIFGQMYFYDGFMMYIIIKVNTPFVLKYGITEIIIVILF